MELKKLTVYAVFYDMEDDQPSAYVTDENDAQLLIAGNDSADYITMEVDPDYWQKMLEN